MQKEEQKLEKKKLKEPKPYKHKMKQKAGSIITLFSPEGILGQNIFCGSAGHECRSKYFQVLFLTFPFFLSFELKNLKKTSENERGQTIRIRVIQV